MKLGRFIVETHAHAQRFAAGQSGQSVQEQGDPAGQAIREQGKQQRDVSRGRQWEQLSNNLTGLKAYDNSARLLYDMECYGVDMCVLLPAFAMTDDLNAEIIEKHPDKFVAECDGFAYLQACIEGEDEWSIEGQCEALDRLLSSGKFRGIGEVSPYVPVKIEEPDEPREPIGIETAVKNMLAIMAVGQQHNVPVRGHSGAPMGYDLPYWVRTPGSSGANFPGPYNYNPLWIHDLASVFPDVPIIIDHGGVQGWWSERFYEECLHVAAAHDNVFLETGLWWAELYDKALADPNIGADKLLWGTDWGASMGFYHQPGRYPESYAVQRRDNSVAWGPVPHQVDYWGWSLRESARVRMTQDDLNRILGGNAVELYKIEMPYSRLFRPTETR